MELPSLTFFCELESDALVQLFSDPAVLADVQALKAGISLGILDLSDERAGIVRRLNAAGVPLIAWLLLPKEEGYWFNLDNVAQATARYHEFQAWTQAQGLQWAGVGLDIEPDSNEIAALLTRPSGLLPRLAGRLFEDDVRVLHGEAAYDALVQRMQADGYRVESYQLPFIVDERRMKSTLLRRLSGLALVPSADTEVLMLYSSMFRPAGPALLASYGPEAGAIGIGSTGGGVDFGGVDSIPPLSWDELVGDLALARQLNAGVYIFSLEGCVGQGYLAKLKSLALDTVARPMPDTSGVESARRALRAVLWLSAHPGWLLAGLIGLLWLLARSSKHVERRNCCQADAP